jgi:primosomal protein N' (replication factor Y)
MGSRRDGAAGQLELFAPPAGEAFPAGAKLSALIAFSAPLPPLSYAIPPEWEDEIVIGALAEAPLRGRAEIGCVVGLEPIEEAAARSPKGLALLTRRVTLGFAIPADLIDLSRWLADYYMCSLGEALRCVSFAGFRDLAPRRVRGWRLSARWREADLAGQNELRDPLTPRQRRVLDWMNALQEPNAEGFAASAIRDALGVTDGVLKKLAAAGVLEEVSIEAEAAAAAAAASSSSLAAEPPAPRLSVASETPAG